MERLSARHLVNTSHEALPDEAQCPVCLYFDIGHPDVRRILTARDPEGRLLQQVQCKCEGQAQSVRLLQAQQSNLPYPMPSLESPTYSASSNVASVTQTLGRTFFTFSARPGTDAAFRAAVSFADRQGPRCLVLQGQTGSGKSHLLEAIGRRWLNSAWTCRYEVSSAFLERLRHTYAANSLESLQEVVDWYAGQSLLLLDDLGREKATEWGREKLTDIVDERLRNKRWMAIATNLSRAEMSSHLGERMASRLFQLRSHGTNPELEEVRFVALTCGDYRAG